jgi:ubiquitin-protein ligase
MNNINHFFINRRINNEVKKYIKNKLLETNIIDNTLIIYTNDHLFKEINIRIIDGKQYIIFINNNKINKINKINIVLDDNYPFRKPISIKINNYTYKSLIQLSNKQLHMFNIKECLCCTSLTCKDNWSPTSTINKLLTEIILNLSYKERYVMNIIIEVIKRKYLNLDIPIYKYLY